MAVLLAPMAHRVHFMSHELTGKRLELLREMVPEATTIDFLIVA
jgi:hypothetical protein